MMDMVGHLDTETIYELVEGSLEPGRERAAEAHLWRCQECRERREACAMTLGAVRWYAERTPSAPAGYWDAFWARWPVVGEVGARAAWRLAAPLAAAAAVALLALGLWWSVERQGSEVPARLASRTTAAFGPPGVAIPAGEVVAGTAWEEDVEVFRRVRFAVGSMDPLSKGVVLASLADEP